jgi:hydroxyethylthiazole kinase-like uncharacterized protein yjeF
MKIVTAAEMREIDRATSERFGVPSLTLMENAGAAVSRHVVSHYSNAERIVVVCGKGNNGGDGFVAARLLHDAGKKVQVILLSNPTDLKGDAATMFGKLPLTATVVQSPEELNRAGIPSADLYLDAILGTGFKPPVSGLYAAAIDVMNAAWRPTVAVDIPSGADADAMGVQAGTIARAHSIITFTAPRPAHMFSALSSGPTVVANIGSPTDAIISGLQLNLITPADLAEFVALRPADSNKGSFGHVLVVGGSFGKAGSVAMAGMAALRSGAGLATVATAKSALSTVAGFYPELMTEPLPENDTGTIATGAGVRIEELLKNMTVLAIGPGISRDSHTAGLVRAVATHARVPAVVDADGLNAFEGHTQELNGGGRTLVITPHPGEMARLAACSTAEVQKNRLTVARTFARDHEVIVVLKGHRTLVVEPGGEAWVNTTGNPGMATGGTGDILTGMVAAMVAQHPKKAMTAVCAAVYLHGLAGDVMLDSVGQHSMVATDLLTGLPEAFRRVRRSAGESIVQF